MTEGFEIAKNKALEVLDEVKVQSNMDRDMLINIARTSLRTKVHPDLADLLTEVRIFKLENRQIHKPKTRCYRQNAPA